MGLGVLAAFLTVHRNSVHPQHLDFEQLLNGLFDFRGRGPPVGGQGELVEFLRLDGPFFSDSNRLDNVKSRKAHGIRRWNRGGPRVERKRPW